MSPLIIGMTVARVILTSSFVFVADDHNYKAAISKLEAQMGHARVIVPYKQKAKKAATEEVAVPAPTYAPMHYFGERCIEFDNKQEVILKNTSPNLIIHGAPGSGKTMVAGNLVINYIQNPVMREDDEEVAFKALFLFPSPKLADDTRTSCLAACDFYGIDKTKMELAEFLTYEDFFEQHTHEGQMVPIDPLTDKRVLTGFGDFAVWYKDILQDQKKIEIKGKKLSAQDCWASFRICSLYSDVRQYKALGKHQCGVPEDAREGLYDIYCLYKSHSEAGRKYSSWTSPFHCDGQYGLVVLDESHNQSGCIVQSAYELAKNGNFVALVGG